VERTRTRIASRELFLRHVQTGPDRPEDGRTGVFRVVRVRALFGARLPGLLDEVTDTLVA
jgi:hypothetical protein